MKSMRMKKAHQHDLGHLKLLNVGLLAVVVRMNARKCLAFNNVHVGGDGLPTNLGLLATAQNCATKGIVEVLAMSRFRHCMQEGH